MGNCFPGIEKKEEYNDCLITDKYCPQCRTRYISNYEYNKHIVNCNKCYGDLWYNLPNIGFI